MDENHIVDYTRIEEAVYKSPHILRVINTPEILKAIDNIFPFSHGIEFECMQKPIYRQYYFESIPDIMDVTIDQNEQRYRIPPGLKGLICLYEVCKGMKQYSIVDLKSSNHYHTDMTDVSHITHRYVKDGFQDIQNSWIISELKKWETAKDVNSAYNGAWYKYNTLRTLEVRIGEPTFEYEIIVKRLIQCTNIVKRLKDCLDLDKSKLYLLQIQLEELEGPKDETTIESDSEMQRIINERNIRT